MANMISLNAVVLCALVASGWAAIDEDLVTDLPGLDTQPTFKHYSGYLNATGTRKLHYWFLESQGDPTSDPVVLWLNGGPGCSSLDGLLTEHGPFFAVENGLKENPYSWNTVANMLYLEAPAGVGFSYAEDGNITTGDRQVAMDNHEALKNFMAHYPEFSHQDFYITGESYGGIYVPTLSALVVDDDDFNFKGFAVGNGVSDDDMNSNSLLFFLYYHGIMGTIAWNDIIQECCHGNMTHDCNIVREATTNQACELAVLKGRKGLEGINIYNLYAECYTEQNRMDIITHPLDARPLHMLEDLEKNPNTLRFQPMKQLRLVPPCIDARDITNYLKRADVRQAIHIPDTVPVWEICSDEVGEHYRHEYSTMRGQYLKVLGTGKQRILVYNGDVDMACNFLGDQWFVNSLNQELLGTYNQWRYTAEDNSIQVAGFVEEFEHISLVTIKGAGHMVPTDKPIPALDMFREFIKDRSPFLHK